MVVKCRPIVSCHTRTYSYYVISEAPGHWFGFNLHKKNYFIMRANLFINGKISFVYVKMQYS